MFGNLFKRNRGKYSYPYLRLDLREGYYIVCKEVSNGMGGYTKAEVGLYKDEKLIKQIVDENGKILDFPGVVHGDWEQDLENPLTPYVRFSLDFGMTENLIKFIWTVQPDGRYWADEDGFGMDDSKEIVLRSSLDLDGNFTEPFKFKDSI